MLTTDEPPVLGSPLTYELGNSLLADTTAFLAISTQPTAAPTTLGGTLNVVMSSLFTLNLVATGLEIPVTVPMDSGLCGVALFYQLFVLDPYATDGVSFSRGLRIVFGN